MGLYELRDSNLPTIPWNKFQKDTSLDADHLWTIRSAVFRGNDLNLPRLVGKRADVATAFALKLQDRLGDNGMVIYYPYFKAEKSGTLDVYLDHYIIEAVEADLWNLVTESKCNVTIKGTENSQDIIGEENFLNQEELKLITKYIGTIRKMFRDELLEGKSVLLEWSLAYDCDINEKPVGERYLVFYEVRTV